MLPSQDHARSHRGGLTAAHCPQALPVSLRGAEGQDAQAQGQAARGPEQRWRKPWGGSGGLWSAGHRLGMTAEDRSSVGGTRGGRGAGWNRTPSCGRVGVAGRRGRNLGITERGGKAPGAAFLPGSQPVTRLDLGASRRGRRGHAMPAHAPDAHDSNVHRAGGVPMWGRRVHARVPRGVTLPRVRGWRRPPAGSHAGSHPDTPPHPRRWAAPCSSAAGKATTCRAPRPGPAWRTSRGAARGPSVSVSDSWAAAGDPGRPGGAGFRGRREEPPFLG